MESISTRQEALNEDEQDDVHVRELTGIVRDALRVSPPLYLSSLMGLPHTWLRRRRYSEFTAISPWQPWQSLRTIVNWTLPSAPFAPPNFIPPVINEIFWQPSVLLQRPDHSGNHTSFPNEHWFFLNGIMTNDAVAQLNAAYLAHLFHRPITMIQNSTDSALVDLLQCAIGKQWQHTTEPVIKAFPVIYDALKSPHKRRVVVIAHSQGTIIIANVLRLLSKVTRFSVPEPALFEREVPTGLAVDAGLGEELAEVPTSAVALSYAEPEFVYPDEMPLKLDEFEPLTPEELGKLEVYCFATCANQLRYVRHATESEPPLPWLEHFGNENDIVARLGMIAPRPEAWGIRIDGPIYMQEDAWGHLLTEHYLFPVEEQQKRGRKRGAVGGSAPFTLVNEDALTPSTFEWTPRLFQYINGGE